LIPFELTSFDLLDFDILLNLQPSKNYYILAAYKKMKKAKFKTVSLDTAIDKHIGKRGTEKREAFENELRIDLLAKGVKDAREERNINQGKQIQS
jgi:hypothetical protein